MAKALPAWNETEELSDLPQGDKSALPSFDETQAIDPEIMPTGFKAPPSKTESFIRGGAQGASLGFADEATGGVEALKDYLLGKADSLGDAYTQHRDESRAAYDAAKDENPLSYMGGQMTGGAAAALLTPELTAGKLGAVALKMGAVGALQGVGESKADLLSADTAKQAALSGLVGGALGAGGTAIANRFRPEALDELAMSTGQRAVGFTKKLLKTDLQKFQAKEGTRLALDKGVLTPFGSIEGMQEATEGISKKAGQAMGDFLEEQSHGATRALKSGAAPQLREQFLFDPQQSITELESLRPKGLNMGDNADINKIIDKAIDTVKAKGTINAKGDYALRPIPWEEGRELKSQIQGMANYDTAASRAVNEMKKKLGGKIRDSFMGQLEDTTTARGAEEGFDAFKGAVKEYGSAESLQDALQNRFSSVAGNNTIGLRDAVVAAGELATSGSPIKALSAGGAMKAVGRYGDQSISWSADRLSKAITSSPQAFQKWLPNLRSAMTRGPQALAVTSFILQQTDPSYSDTLTSMGKNNE